MEVCIRLNLFERNKLEAAAVVFYVGYIALSNLQMNSVAFYTIAKVSHCDCSACYSMVAVASGFAADAQTCAACWIMRACSAAGLSCVCRWDWALRDTSGNCSSAQELHGDAVRVGRLGLHWRRGLHGVRPAGGEVNEQRAGS